MPDVLTIEACVRALCITPPDCASDELRDRFQRLVRASLQERGGVQLRAALEDHGLWRWIEVAAVLAASASSHFSRRRKWIALDAHGALQLGELERAESLARKALERRRPKKPGRESTAREGSRAIPRALSVLGALAALRGDDIAALTSYAQALKLTKDSERCGVLLDYAAAQLRLHRFEPAARTLEQAQVVLRAERSEQRRATHLARIRSYQALVAASAGDAMRAVNLQRKALQTANRLNAPNLQHEIRLALADHLISANNSREAEAILSAAVTLSGDSLTHAEILLMRARLLLSGGLYAGAREAYGESLALLLPPSNTFRRRWCDLCLQASKDVTRLAQQEDDGEVSSQAKSLTQASREIRTSLRESSETALQLCQQVTQLIERLRYTILSGVGGRVITPTFIVDLKEQRIEDRRTGEAYDLNLDQSVVVRCLGRKYPDFLHGDQIIQAMAEAGVPHADDGKLKAAIYKMRGLRKPIRYAVGELVYCSDRRRSIYYLEKPRSMVDTKFMSVLPL